MKYFIISLFLLSCNAFSTDSVIKLKQFDNKKKFVSEEIRLNILNPDTNLNYKLLKNSYLTPYLYVLDVTDEEILALITNENKNFKKNTSLGLEVSFLIEEENIDKTPLDMKDYFFVYNQYKEKSYFLIIVILIVTIFTSVAYRFLYPRYLLKRKWRTEQKTIKNFLLKVKNQESLEELYKKKEVIKKYLKYDESKVNSLLMIIDDNQYKRSWDNGKVSEALDILNSISFKEKKYDRN